MKNLPDNAVDAEYLVLVGEILKPFKQLSYDYLGVKSGHKVLDIGCGIGLDTSKLSEMVQPDGKVFGIDMDAVMIQNAKKAAIKEKHHDIIKFIISNAEKLPFGSNHFDSVRADRVIQNVTTPEIALNEMIRITKSNGRIVILDTDWNTLSIDTSQVDLCQRLKNYLLRDFNRNGFEGVQLYKYFKSKGLYNIQFHICPVAMTNYEHARKSLLLDNIEQCALKDGIVTEEELFHWHNELENNRFFFGTVNLMLISGCKP